ncbi:MAG: SEC-C metal-binding domain-containing protein, partial [Clostridiaceae bacterium]|nr:SEC-C metal-binding domain-containing protein [Clostridiaceae bacterium]
EYIMEMIAEVIGDAVATYTVGSEFAEEWDIKGLIEYLHTIFLPKNTINREDLLKLSREELTELIMDRAVKIYENKESQVDVQAMREVERVALLRSVDTKWIDHIDAMDQLREGISLRAYGQKDPVQAYQMEGYDIFLEPIRNIKEDTIRFIYNVNISNMPKREKVAEPVVTNQEGSVRKPVVKEEKTGRNDPCPCGSGKKYKKCCGANNN